MPCLFGVTFLLLLCFLKDVTSQVVPEYVGCFNEGSGNSKFTLSGFKGIYKGLTALDCNTLCFSKGFLYSAIKNGQECHCGDIEGSLSPSVNESECNVLCGGIEDVMCGGRNAFSLYLTGINEEGIELDEEEVGCLADGGDTRLIKQHKVDLYKTNSPLRCVAYCKALGYRHAGVQYSFECHCGEAEKLFPLVTGCDMPCVNGGLNCGGNWRMNVYTTGITRPTPGISLKGCYNYVSSGVKERRVFQNISPNKCIAFCFSQSYSIASIYNGTECLCGNKSPLGSTKTKRTDCNIPCRGNSNHMCGSSDHMSTYNTGAVGAPSLGKLQGCYTDYYQDILSGPKYNLGVDNSIDQCLSTCIERGFAFAAVKNSYECHCGNTGPKKNPIRIIKDSECDQLPCLARQIQPCGGAIIMLLFRTGLDRATAECEKSLTVVNEQEVCTGQLVLNENFESLNSQFWRPSIKISGEDYEFVTYSKSEKNIFIENGKLVIKPTLVDDQQVLSGSLSLQGCTGIKSFECSRQAQSFNILPPVESGQICTKKSFSYKFGIINVRAKLPKGDWVVPQIWLKPVKEVYGPDYKSGKVVIAMARGNQDLTNLQGSQIGSSLLETGYLLSKDSTKSMVGNKVLLLNKGSWSDSFYNYSVLWTSDRIEFYLDGSVLDLKTLYQYNGRTAASQAGISGDDLNIWKKGSVMAPFDQEFYICLGVSVGGNVAFPEESVSNRKEKPWKNYNVKALYDFWSDKENWAKTWTEQDTRLEVEHVSVRAYS